MDVVTCVRSVTSLKVLGAHTSADIKTAADLSLPKDSSEFVDLCGASKAGWTALLSTVKLPCLTLVYVERPTP